jgi:hypothetical protein
VVVVVVVVVAVTVARVAFVVRSGAAVSEKYVRMSWSGTKSVLRLTNAVSKLVLRLIDAVTDDWEHCLGPSDNVRCS